MLNVVVSWYGIISCDKITLFSCWEIKLGKSIILHIWTSGLSHHVLWMLPWLPASSQQEPWGVDLTMLWCSFSTLRTHIECAVYFCCSVCISHVNMRRAEVNSCLAHRTDYNQWDFTRPACLPEVKIQSSQFLCAWSREWTVTVLCVCFLCVTTRCVSLTGVVT